MFRSQRHNLAARGLKLLMPSLCLLIVDGMTGCVSSPALIQTERVGPLPPNSTHEPLDGELVVFSATRTGTVGQSEYPLHTDYVIRGSSAGSIRNVANQSGLFAQDPAAVKLLPGEYQVKALAEGGGYVVVPVTIEAGKRTIVDLDGTVMPQGPGDSRWVKLPDGQVVGWQARSELKTDESR